MLGQFHKNRLFELDCGDKTLILGLLKAARAEDFHVFSKMKRNTWKFPRKMKIWKKYVEILVDNDMVQKKVTHFVPLEQPR